MNLVDALVLVVLAILDLAIIAHLRHRRSVAHQRERVEKSLQLAVRRENGEIVMPRRRRLLLRAS
jgi:hypothetical protein